MNRLFYKLLSIPIIVAVLFGCNAKESSTDAENNQEGIQKNISRIAFGSCNRQDSPQPLWEPIRNEEPDLWIWLGDNIYGDTHNMGLMEEKYDEQYNHPEYSQLRNSTEVIGIWDDHDYGTNDGGVNYTKKDSSQQLMLDFLDEPEGSERWQQKGAYVAYTYGEAGQKVKIYLLDARYHRDTLKKENGQYLPNDTGTILGEEQWEWLEREFKESDADINLIASGIQFIPEEHPYEKWANFPNERQRLFDLITSSGINGAVLISGDRHIAEVSQISLKEGPELYEFTSSGLTHTWKDYQEEPNQYRVGELMVALNYGLLDIDWDKKQMNFQIKGEDQKAYLSQTVLF